MQIAWVSIAAPVPSQGGGLHSGLASVRYRMIQPARELEGLGHRVSFIHPHSERAAEAARSADVLVFGKLMSQGPGDGFAATARAYDNLLRGLKDPCVVFDVNDDYFDVAGYANFYRGYEPAAWTTSTGALAEVIAQFSRAPILVVPEPYESPLGAARAPAKPRSLLDGLLRPRREVTPAELLWFGHPTSLPELSASMEEIVAAAKRHPLHLRCVTAPGQGAEQLCESRQGAHGLRVSFQPWSPAATWRALEVCDVVILPAKLSKRLARGKSANRMVEALRAGRFAIAHPRPAYIELSRYAWVGESLADGVAWALAHPREALTRISLGQRFVETEYSPGAIAQKWLAAFHEARSPVH